MFFALTGAAVFVLRWKEARLSGAEGSLGSRGDAPWRALGYPVAPALFVLGEIGVVIGAHQDPDVRKAALIGTAWIAVAAVVYLIWFRRRV